MTFIQKTITFSLILVAPILSAMDEAKPEVLKSEMHAEHSLSMSEPVGEAVAVIFPTEGNKVTGEVVFKKVKDGVQVTGKVINLSPGKHGFHVHEKGDLSKPDGTATGGHFNPEGHPHSSPDAMIRHQGDLGNIVADENGVAEFEFVDSELMLNGPFSIVGRGLIIHAGEDDLASQPTGAAGARVGMAVIGIR